MLTEIKTVAADYDRTISEFIYLLNQEILNNVYQFHTDNIDFERFGYPSRLSIFRRILNECRKFAATRGVVFVSKTFSDDKHRLWMLKDHLGGFAYLYRYLTDETSKDLLVKLVVFRMLDNERVKLPINTADYWAKYNLLRSIINHNDFIQIDFLNWKLYHFFLDKIGYPINVYCAFVSLLNTFLLKQYECHGITPIIKAEPGEVVIDGGGCWGDTALYFAHEVGEQGSVYSFEFMPENVELMKRNFSLNPSISNRVKLIEHALWNRSGEVVHAVDIGPGSKVSKKQTSVNDIPVRTISIDEFVEQRKISRVDFIKLDVEGSELAVLQGAVMTLRRFRPKLAIALYHNLSDFRIIPEFLLALDLGYKLYMRHFTIHAEETILFATA